MRARLAFLSLASLSASSFSKRPSASEASLPWMEEAEAEAKAEGFSSRAFWLEEWDHLVSAVSGRSHSRSAAANPTVVVMTLHMHHFPIDEPKPRKVAA